MRHVPGMIHTRMEKLRQWYYYLDVAADSMGRQERHHLRRVMFDCWRCYVDYEKEYRQKLGLLEKTALSNLMVYFRERCTEFKKIQGETIKVIMKLSAFIQKRLGLINRTNLQSLRNSYAAWTLVVKLLKVENYLEDLLERQRRLDWEIEHAEQIQKAYIHEAQQLKNQAEEIQNVHIPMKHQEVWERKLRLDREFEEFYENLCEKRDATLKANQQKLTDKEKFWEDTIHSMIDVYERTGKDKENLIEDLRLGTTKGQKDFALITRGEGLLCRACMRQVMAEDQVVTRYRELKDLQADREEHASPRSPKGKRSPHSPRSPDRSRSPGRSEKNRSRSPRSAGKSPYSAHASVRKVPPKVPHPLGYSVSGKGMEEHFFRNKLKGVLNRNDVLMRGYLGLDLNKEEEYLKKVAQREAEFQGTYVPEKPWERPQTSYPVLIQDKSGRSPEKKKEAMQKIKTHLEKLGEELYVRITGCSFASSL